MNKNNSHPLIVRGPDNILEIPTRMQEIDAIKDITRRTRGRFTEQSYTIEEVSGLLEKGDPIDTINMPYLDLMEAIGSGHATMIQLMAHKRWKILCLVDLVGKGWSSLQTTPEGQIGIFHTGSKLSLGTIPAQYLIQDDESVEIAGLIKKQKNQPDIIAWRDKTF